MGLLQYKLSRSQIEVTVDIKPGTTSRSSVKFVVLFLTLFKFQKINYFDILFLRMLQFSFFQLYFWFCKLICYPNISYSCVNSGIIIQLKPQNWSIILNCVNIVTKANVYNFNWPQHHYGHVILPSILDMLWYLNIIIFMQ